MTELHAINCRVPRTVFVRCTICVGLPAFAAAWCNTTLFTPSMSCCVQPNPPMFSRHRPKMNIFMRWSRICKQCIAFGWISGPTSFIASVTIPPHRPCNAGWMNGQGVALYLWQKKTALPVPGGTCCLLQDFQKCKTTSWEVDSYFRRENV